ncbi:hypothetical protein CF98_17585 [Halopseudomonas bauzanensis]|nr:hypothetical protein CF98_17585 [Halopseudomonas bauzanensis]
MNMNNKKGRNFPEDWLPRPEDELLHEPSGDESLPWKETFYISVRDESANATVSMHMTVSANRSPDTRCHISITQGAQSASQVLREDGTNNTRQIGNRLSRLEMVNLSWDSDHELRWVGNLEDVEFDLTLKGKHYGPLWDSMFKGFYATGKTGQVYRHSEQVITAQGWLRWRNSDKRISFSGFGWRDRGWGRRKTQIMWDTSWDLMAAVLPDNSVFSIIALRSHEISKSAPMPVAGWWSDATTLTPCVGGVYHKEATACPKHFDLRFENGQRITGDLVRPTGRNVVAMQESEVGPEAPNMAAAMQDYYAIFVDPMGREFPVFTQSGYIHKVDAFRNAQFISASAPPCAS